VKQQLGVDLQLPLEHETLERLPGEVAKLDRDPLTHLPVRREDGAHVVLEVDQVPFEPVEPIVNLKKNIGPFQGFSKVSQWAESWWIHPFPFEH